MKSSVNLSGLSGNEIYCLAQKNWSPGGIVVGNSVQSLGLIGNISSGLKSIAGGEIENLTSLISEGRHAAIARIEAEARQHGAQGLTGVATELKTLGGLVEFLSIGSAVHSREYDGPFFSTACTGQDFYCHLDAGYEPRHFVIGNVAYSLGLGRGITGSLRTIGARGEVREFSDLYNHTRHLALSRLELEATQRGCNSVVDIRTEVLSVAGIREMLMVGTGSHNAVLGDLQTPVTSELTGEELWNLTKLGFAPVKLVLGTSVYSLGLASGLNAWLKSFSRGEVDEVTKLVYEARENALDHIRSDARACGAEQVIGTKLFVHEIGGGMIEVLAIGTAIRRQPGVQTKAETLLPQAIIRDRDTFFDASLTGSLGREHGASDSTPQANPVGCLIALVVFGSMATFVACAGFIALLTNR